MPTRHIMDIHNFLDTVYVTDCFKFVQNLPGKSVDLMIADGPYAVTQHDWDKINSVQEYNLDIIKMASYLLTHTGSLYLFGKSDCIDFIPYNQYLHLNAKIIWYSPARLAQGRKNYTNNYDLIVHFSKTKNYTFNLDDIRVPQLVELTHRMRCEKVPSVKGGKFSKTKFNNKGKNPGNVWGDIKQLTYKSKELVARHALNTIQKPEALMKRIILASSNPGDIIFDPFVGVGTTLKVAKELGRQAFGCEINKEYARMATLRLHAQDYSCSLQSSGHPENIEKTYNPWSEQSKTQNHIVA